MARHFVSCFDNSVHVQKSDLDDLLRASASPAMTDSEVRAIIEKCMQHYEDYSEQRRTLAHEDGSAFFSPPWCPSFENSMLWIGGCRPSLAIRLLYSITGSQMDAHLEEFLKGQYAQLEPVGLMGLTARQLQDVNELHNRTICAENRLSSRLATIQEDVADKPLLPIIIGQQNSMPASSTVRMNDGDRAEMENDGDRADMELETVMQTYAEGLARLVGEADGLRLSTARTLVKDILSPRQAVELLVAAKKLHLSMHELAVKRDRQLGRG